MNNVVTVNTKSRWAESIEWDDGHIEQEAKVFPASLQPLYRWLKEFVRSECNADPEILVQRAGLVGVTIDITNWIRILKGRWKLDAHGNELPNPYISAVNLTHAITAIRDQVRVELLQGGMPFVETSTVNTIRRFINKKLRKDRVNKWGVIVGPTGTQKTATYKELCQRTPGLRWVESNSNCSLRELVMRLSRKCGYRGATTTAAKTAIMDAMSSSLSNSGNKGIIVDNMQEMVRREMDGKRLKDKQTAYEFFREVQDETGCTIIWSITPESEDDMFDSKSIYFEQFEGRAGGRESFLRLTNYPPIADLVQIAQAIGFKDASDHKELLKAIGHARGRIRRFFEIFQEARDSADADKSPLTVDYVEAALEEYKLPDQTAKKAA